ncbi:replication endonuclease [Limnobaculum xujianqingii]|uniref:replication endonuclease n=1 Tax=Limnobaculum xujianqingii TaxID=2738837 RepID=UPI0011298398|nr:replication endonuclease [Limnobaculum xujianqingii]
MAIDSRGRYAPSEPAPYPGIVDNTRYVYQWNQPRKVVDLAADDEIKTPEVTGVSPLVARHLEKLNKNYQPLGLAAIDRIKRQALEEKTAHHNQMERWPETLEGIQQHFNEQPFFIRQALLPKINWLRDNRDQKHVNAFIMGTVKKALLRLDRVRRQQSVNSGHSSELAAYYFRRWPHLAEFSKKEVIAAAYEIAGRLGEMFETECSAMETRPSEMPDDDLLWIYQHLGTEMFALRVTPPEWGSLNSAFDRRLCYSSILRITNPDWWGRKLWRLRCEWRENQFRAAGVIHKKRMAYVSFDALSQWQEQRRKNRSFYQSHELVDDDDNVVSLEDMVNASVSNRAIRRHELMNRMAGVELIAQSRGDIGVFLTITCPSKYHSNIQSGHHNPKWNHTSTRQGQRYLCLTWGRATSALKRQGLRPYGFRVAEPHHDGTPHWHVLLFMPPEQLKETVKILRDYFIAEDRQELGRRTGARFKSKKLDPTKGSATAYVAKYISKNIDGYALDGELDTETGKPLKDTAKYAMAWASQHNIRQFQPFGQPPVTVWRELRKLNNQLVAIQKEAGIFRPGKKLLSDSDMDAVLAAADVGCFASYIEKQGGVLIPRDRYTVRLAYEESEELNTYGETSEKIYGVFSPRLGITSRICTRTTKWKIRAKQTKKREAQSAEALEALGPLPPQRGPWSSVNNSTGDQKIIKKELPVEQIDSTSESEMTVSAVDFDEMSDKERRALLRRVRNQPPDQQKIICSSSTPRNKEACNLAFSQQAAELRVKIEEFAQSLGWQLSQHEVRRLAAGHKVDIDGRYYRARSDGCIYAGQQEPRARGAALMDRISRLRVGTA